MKFLKFFNMAFFGLIVLSNQMLIASNSHHFAETSLEGMPPELREIKWMNFYAYAFSGDQKKVIEVLNTEKIIPEEALFHTFNIYLKRNKIDQIDLEIIKKLLEHGALKKIEAKTSSLHRAIETKNLELAKLFLDFGADINFVVKCKKNGKPTSISALGLAIDSGAIDIAKLLIEQINIKLDNVHDGDSALYIAAGYGSKELVKLLLEKDVVSIDKVNSDLLTPLILAAACGKIEIVELLLNHQANLKLKDRFSQSALHHASRKGHKEIVAILLDHGADVDESDKEGWTPLMIAVDIGDIETVKLLLERKASLELKNKHVFSALHYASREGHNKIVAMLLDHGADINSITKEGYTPLHISIIKNHLGCVPKI